MTFSQKDSSCQEVKYSKNGIGYLLYLPQDDSTQGQKKLPLILFLHGVGETSYKVKGVRRQALPLLLENKKDFGFVVVSPQCKPFHIWDIEALKLLVDEVIETTGADKERIYLTGISMGGFATWAMAIRYPDFFAAIVPVCGGGRKKDVYRIREVPVWAFHGAQDMIVPISQSKRMVNALLKAGGDVRLTIFPKMGHKCWNKVYVMPELYTWLLSHKKQE